MIDLFADAEPAAAESAVQATQNASPVEPEHSKRDKPLASAAPRWGDDSELVVFDIETGPLDEDYVRSIVPPFDSNSLGEHPGEFDPAKVKLGRLKDPAKIEKKIEDEREAHAQKVAKWNENAANAEPNYWREVMSKAALSPVTGQVLAIGYTQDSGPIEIDEGDERELLSQFWSAFDAGANPYCGWNIAGFDVWFLVNRSRILGIPHCSVLDRSGRYLDGRRFLDLMDHWNCGSRSFYDPLAGKNKTGAKAKNIARLLGVARPHDATPCKHGGDFAEFWHGTPDQQEQARIYLRWDLREELEIARIFGVL